MKTKNWLTEIKTREVKIKLWHLIVIFVTIGATIGGVTTWQKEPEQTSLTQPTETPEEFEYTIYEHWIEIPTYYIATVSTTLGAGQEFGANLYIYKADKDEAVFPAESGTLIFYICDPYGNRIIDAGRIEGQYEFTLTAEVSGEYWLNFIDREGPCIVVMNHNSIAPLRDVSIIPLGCPQY